MWFENSNVIVKKSWSWKEYWSLEVWKFIDSWWSQSVFQLLWNMNWKVLKTLDSNEMLHDFQDIDNTDFYYTILKTIEKMWVLLPNEWDVINIWEEKEKLAFIQTHISDINEVRWTIPIFPRALTSEPEAKKRILQEYTVNKEGELVFFDWDQALPWMSRAIFYRSDSQQWLEVLLTYGDTYKFEVEKC